MSTSPAIHLLGSFHLVAGDEATGGLDPRLKELVAYLLLNRHRPVSRQHLPRLLLLARLHRGAGPRKSPQLIVLDVEWEVFVRKPCAIIVLLISIAISQAKLPCQLDTAQDELRFIIQPAGREWQDHRGMVHVDDLGILRQLGLLP